MALILLAAAAAATATPSSGSAQHQGPVAKIEKAKSGPETPKEPNAAKTVIEPPDRGDHRDSHEATEEQQRRSEIEAQWVSARAAESAAEAAWIFGKLGSVIGGITLVAAGLAAIYARMSATESKRSANYALFSYEAFTRVEDASLVVSMPVGHTAEGRDDLFIVDVLVTNVGRSAARILWFQMEGDNPIVIDKTLMPGAQLALPKIESIKRAGETSIAAGTIEYGSAIDPKQTHEFSGGILLDHAREGQAFGLILSQGRKRKEQQSAK